VGTLFLACDVDVIDTLCKCKNCLLRLGLFRRENGKTKIHWRQNRVVLLVYPFFGTFGGEDNSVHWVSLVFQFSGHLSCENSFFH